MLFQRLCFSFVWPLGSPDRQELRLLGGAPVCRQDSLRAQQLGAKKEYSRSHVACFGEASEVTQSHTYCHLQTTQVEVYKHRSCYLKVEKPIFRFKEECWHPLWGHLGNRRHHFMTGFAHVLPVPSSRCYSGVRAVSLRNFQMISRSLHTLGFKDGILDPLNIFLISSESSDLRIKGLGLDLMEFAIRDGDKVTVSLIRMRITGFLQDAGKKGLESGK